MQARPKLLSRFTLDAALTLQLDVDNAGSYNESIAVTVPAGSYYMAWDMQSDDFLYVLMTAISTALQAQATSVVYNGNDSNGKLVFWIDADHHVNVIATNESDIRISWTEDDGPTVAGILGFDATAALELGNGSSYSATADWHHAYGWYADEDGYTSNESREDVDEPTVKQSFTPDGVSKTVYFASVFSNILSLEHVLREKTWSRGVGYTETSVYPYAKNEPLECWWREARQGIPFRVYGSNQIDTSLAGEHGVATGATTTTVTDGNKSWDIDPQRHAGTLLYTEEFGSGVDLSARFYISSHTATVLTVPNALLNSVPLPAASTYYIFEQRYRTYVLDTAKTSSFNPVEQNPANERHNFTISMRRYVT